MYKTFYCSRILEQYNKNNNKKKSQLKQFILQTFQQALKHKIIQGHCQIEFKNERKTQDIEILKLNSLLIGQSKLIHFYERLF